MRALTADDRQVLAAHFLALSADDRRLRFGATLTDASVETYVDAINFRTDAVLGAYDDDSHLVGVVHLVRTPHFAELGLSVLGANQGGGIGTELMRGARAQTREWGLRKIFVHYQSGNTPMRRLAHGQHMKITSVMAESDGWLTLPLSVALTWPRPSMTERSLVDPAKSRKH